MIETYLLEVTSGWSIPDLGIFLAEWLGPTELVVVLPSGHDCDLANLEGVVGVRAVDEAFAAEVVRPQPGNALGWRA